jgi:hypothetical protein
MAIDPQKKVLLSSLDNARSFVLSALADYEEECGDPDLAMAWRWLRDNNRWPGFKTVKAKYNWDETRKEYLWYYKEDWQRSRNGSALPDNIGYYSTYTYHTESEAFQAVVGRIAIWLKKQDEVKSA